MPQEEHKQDIKIAQIMTTLDYIKKEIEEINDKLEGHYVNKYEFEPIKKIVYGLVAIILTAVVGGLVSLVVIQ